MGARDSAFDEKSFTIVAPRGTPEWLRVRREEHANYTKVEARAPAVGPGWEEVFHHRGWDFDLKRWRSIRSKQATRTGVPAERDIVEQVSDDFLKQLRGEPFYPLYRAERLYDGATYYIVKPEGRRWKSHIVGSIHGYYVKGETAVRDLFSTVKILHQGSPVWLADFKTMKLDRVLTLWELLMCGAPEMTDADFVYSSTIGYVKIGRKTLWPVSEAQWNEGQFAPFSEGGPAHVPGLYETREAGGSFIAAQKRLLEGLKKEGWHVEGNTAYRERGGVERIQIEPVFQGAIHYWGPVRASRVALGHSSDGWADIREISANDVLRWVADERSIEFQSMREDSQAHDYPDLEQALLGAQSKLDATHASGPGHNLRVYSPTSQGYFVHRLERGGGSLHWFKSAPVGDLPRDARMIHEIIRGGLVDPDVAPTSMRRAAEPSKMQAMAGERKVAKVRVGYDDRFKEWEATAYDSRGRAVNVIRGEYEEHVRTRAKRLWPDATFETHDNYADETPIAPVTPEPVPAALEAREPSPVADPAIPWVKVERNPEQYAEAMKLAAKIGPIEDARAVYDLLAPALAKEDQETFIVVLLDVRSQLRGVCEVHRGGRSHVGVDSQDVLRVVVTSGAESFIGVHNHPTGKASPSKADGELTEALNRASQEVGVAMRDHVVIGRGQYFSFDKDKLYKVKH